MAKLTEMDKRIIQMPISKPYWDFTDWMRIDQPALQYALAAGVVNPTNSFYDKLSGYDENRIPEFMFCRWQAAKVFAEKIDENRKDREYRLKLSGDCELDTGLISHMCNLKRFFCVPARSMEALRKYTLLSCHELMFGEQGQVVIPGRFSVIAREFPHFSAKAKDSLCALEDRLYENFLADNTQDYAPKQHQPFTDLIRRRISLYMEDHIYDYTDILGRKALTPKQFRHSATMLFETEGFLPNYNFFMYFSKKTNIALDYFICEDFFSYIPVFYTDKNGCDRQLKPRSETYIFMKKLFEMDKERQEILCRAAFKELFRQANYGTESTLKVKVYRRKPPQKES